MVWMKKFFFVAIAVLNITATRDRFITAQWSQFSSFQTSSINDVVIADNGYIFVAPANGGIWRAKGITSNWQSLGIDQSSDIQIIPKILIAREMMWIGTAQGLYRSLDLGDSWMKILDPSDERVLSPMAFFFGRLFARNLSLEPSAPHLYCSEDNGSNWSAADSGLPPVKVFAMTSLAEKLYAVSDSGVFMSADSGRSWLPANNGLKTALRFIVSITSDLIVSTGEGGRLPDLSTTYRSTDGGESWHALDVGSAIQTTAMYVYQGKLLRGSFYGGVTASTDNGNTWSSLGMSPWHTPLCFGSHGDTLIVGEEFYDFTPGTGGLWIYKYSPVDVQMTGQNTREFYMGSNYPNPFNPSTTIEYSLPAETYVTLRIYNALGQEVGTLVSRKMPSGAHSVVWNASKNTSGIYVYKLQAGTHTIVKKMLLAK